MKLLLRCAPGEIACCRQDVAECEPCAARSVPSAPGMRNAGTPEWRSPGGRRFCSGPKRCGAAELSELGLLHEAPAVSLASDQAALFE